MVEIKLREDYPFGAQDFPLAGRVVNPGDVISVTEDQARGLLEQVDKWAPADPGAHDLAPQDTDPAAANLIVAAPAEVLRDPQPRDVIQPATTDVQPARVLETVVEDQATGADVVDIRPTENNDDHPGGDAA